MKTHSAVDVSRITAKNQGDRTTLCCRVHGHLSSLVWKASLLVSKSVLDLTVDFVVAFAGTFRVWSGRSLSFSKSELDLTVDLCTCVMDVTTMMCSISCRM